MARACPLCRKFGRINVENGTQGCGCGPECAGECRGSDISWHIWLLVIVVEWGVHGPCVLSKVEDTPHNGLHQACDRVIRASQSNLFIRGSVLLGREREANMCGCMQSGGWGIENGEEEGAGIEADIAQAKWGQVEVRSGQGCVFAQAAEEEEPYQSHVSRGHGSTAGRCQGSLGHGDDEGEGNRFDVGAGWVSLGITPKLGR